MNEISTCWPCGSWTPYAYKLIKKYYALSYPVVVNAYYFALQSSKQGRENQAKEEQGSSIYYDGLTYLDQFMNESRSIFSV